MVSEGNLKGADGRQLFLTEERDQWLRHAALAACVGDAGFPQRRKCFVKLFKAKWPPPESLNHR